MKYAFVAVFAVFFGLQLWAADLPRNRVAEDLDLEHLKELSTELHRNPELSFSIHSPFYYPYPEPTIRTGVTVLTAAALDLLKKDR